MLEICSKGFFNAILSPLNPHGLCIFGRHGDRGHTQQLLDVKMSLGMPWILTLVPQGFLKIELGVEQING